MTDKHGIKKVKKNEKFSQKIPKNWKTRQNLIVAQGTAFEENDGSQVSKNGNFWQAMNGLKFTRCQFCSKKMYESALPRHYETKHPIIMNR